MWQDGLGQSSFTNMKGSEKAAIPPKSIGYSATDLSRISG